MEKVTKFSRPTVYDKAPFGTKWTADFETGNELYVQLSKDENVSHWSKLGDFLEKMHTDEMIEGCLKDYEKL